MSEEVSGYLKEVLNPIVIPRETRGNIGYICLLEISAKSNFILFPPQWYPFVPATIS